MDGAGAPDARGRAGRRRRPDHDVARRGDRRRTPARTEDVAAARDEDPRSDAERERDEYLDALRRLQADFENYRKRVERQFEELAARGVTALVEQAPAGARRARPRRGRTSWPRTSTRRRARRRRPRRSCRRGRSCSTPSAKEGLERVGRRRRAVRPDGARRRRARRGRGRADRRRGAARGVPVARAGASARDGESQGLMAERSWLETDYYKALGVASTATDKEITRAYRKLAKAHHPDTNPGSEERFKEISAAYDVLGDPAKRKEYDEVRRLGPMGGAFGGSGGFRAPGRHHVHDGRPRATSATCFGGLFGSRRRAPKRGADVETALHLSFEDAVRGVTTSVHLPTDAPCRTCKGTGAAPGTTPVECERCHGRGVLDDDKGMFSLSTICPVCQGRGVRIETPCPTCHGSGREASSRSVKVRIPPGVEGGQRIRVQRQGPARPAGRAAGRPLRRRPRRRATRGSAARAATSRRAVPISFARRRARDRRRRRHARRPRHGPRAAGHVAGHDAAPPRARRPRARQGARRATCS